MMERLSVYFTRRRLSVSVEDEGGITREASGPDPLVVLASMHGDDLETLVRFCRAVVEFTEGQPARLRDW